MSIEIYNTRYYILILYCLRTKIVSLLSVLTPMAQIFSGSGKASNCGYLDVCVEYIEY